MIPFTEFWKKLKIQWHKADKSVTVSESRGLTEARKEHKITKVTFEDRGNVLYHDSDGFYMTVHIDQAN